MTLLASHQITEYLRDTPAWALHDGSIRRTYTFSSFLTSVAFVQQIAECAEKFQHHPELDIRFDKVLVMFTTHDVGGLTSKDFLLAEKCDKMFGETQKIMKNKIPILLLTLALTLLSWNAQAQNKPLSAPTNLRVEPYAPDLAQLQPQTAPVRPIVPTPMPPRPIDPQPGIPPMQPNQPTPNLPPANLPPVATNQPPHIQQPPPNLPHRPTVLTNHIPALRDQTPKLTNALPALTNRPPALPNPPAQFKGLTGKN